MKHISFSDKSFVVGDEVADLLMQYAKELARSDSADTVELHAINSDGSETDAELLLNSGTVISTETVNTTVPEPDNSDAERYLREQLGTLAAPPHAQGIGSHAAGSVGEF